MCSPFDALPPDLPSDLILPALGGGAAAEHVVLTAADGNAFSAAIAPSGRPGGTGVVILPDIRGLYRFYVELAERFAAAGHSAIALDYFGRTAGTGERDEDFEWMPHIMATEPAHVQADVAAAAATLRERTGVDRVVTVGFCFGGTHSFLSAANPDLGLAGAVGFYGGLEKSRLGLPEPRAHAAAMTCPVLGLFGGADEGITAEHREHFDEALTTAGVAHEIVVYDGAPHSFFDRSFAEHAAASEDAWRRVLAFVEAAG